MVSFISCCYAHAVVRTTKVTWRNNEIRVIIYSFHMIGYSLVDDYQKGCYSPEHGWWNFRSSMSYIKTGRNLLSCKPKYLLLNEWLVSKNITPLKLLKNWYFWAPRPTDKMHWFRGRAFKTCHLKSLLLVNSSLSANLVLCRDPFSGKCITA